MNKYNDFDWQTWYGDDIQFSASHDMFDKTKGDLEFRTLYPEVKGGMVLGCSPRGNILCRHKYLPFEVQLPVEESRTKTRELCEELFDEYIIKIWKIYTREK